MTENAADYKVDLKGKIPQFYLDNPDNEDFVKFIDIEEITAAKKKERTYRILKHLDIKTRDYEFLWNDLKEKGWNLKLAFNEYQLRALLETAATILKNRGWLPTTLDAVYKLWREDLKSTLLTAESEGYWVVEKSKVGYFKVGPSKQVEKIYSETEIDSDKIADIEAFIMYLRPATFKYLFGWQQQIAFKLKYFTVGYTKIGDGTKLIR